jgi:hypothetical protein
MRGQFKTLSIKYTIKENIDSQCLAIAPLFNKSNLDSTIKVVANIINKFRRNIDKQDFKKIKKYIRFRRFTLNNEDYFIYTLGSFYPGITYNLIRLRDGKEVISQACAIYLKTILTAGDNGYIECRMNETFRYIPNIMRIIDKINWHYILMTKKHNPYNYLWEYNAIYRLVKLNDGKHIIKSADWIFLQDIRKVNNQLYIVYKKKNKQFLTRTNPTKTIIKNADGIFITEAQEFHNDLYVEYNKNSKYYLMSGSDGKHIIKNADWIYLELAFDLGDEFHIKYKQNKEIHHVILKKVNKFSKIIKDMFKNRLKDISYIKISKGLRSAA